MINVNITGNLACDCELRSHDNKGYYYFRVAARVNNERTEFVTCYVNYDISKISNFLKKGKYIYVDGHARIDTFQDKGGGFQARLAVNVNNVELMGDSRSTSDVPF